MLSKLRMYAHYYSFTYSTQSDERLPDMMWCREPFLEVMKDIDDLNYAND